MPQAQDPYRTLGVDPGASDEELRVAYRKLVQRHHPDHNGGSREAATRFEEIQEAYTEVRRRRAGAPPGSAQPPPSASPRAGGDPKVAERIAVLEEELRRARAAREAAQRAAREAARSAGGESGPRPSDEELGYVTTDDSLTKIFADARTELAKLLDRLR